MCGIVGILGLPEAPAKVRKGLEILEYRGYDSAGICWPAGKGLVVAKEVGRVAGLPSDLPDATMALGHTRWATHGGVTKANAHPHLDTSGRFAVVHNGTIEHHRRLRRELEAEGVHFVSETDTEVLVHRYARERKNSAPIEALRAMLRGLEGSWATVVIDAQAGALAFARNRTPLVLGIAANAVVLASDITALLAHTRRVVILEDGDHGVADATGVTLLDGDGVPKPLAVQVIDWDVAQAEKGGYPHFMLKEIHETPAVLNQCIGDRIRQGQVPVEVGLNDGLFDGVNAVRLVACGTSYHASKLGAAMLEAWAGIPAQAVCASDLRDRPALDEPGLLYIGVSQSGETLDMLEALRSVATMGRLLAVSNVQGSALQRLADQTLLTRVGPEIGVAATKTFTGQVATLAMVAIELGLARHALDARRASLLAQAMRRMPRTLDGVLLLETDLAALGHRLSAHRSLFFLGQGPHVATALEAALKFKEVTYLHAEGFAAAELKHGPFAMLDADTPCVFFVTDGPGYGRLLGSIQEVRARGAPVHVLTTAAVEDLEGLADTIISIPATDPLLAALPFGLAGQMLAYHAAAALGRDIDKPRNLAKSVTVE